MAKTKRRRSFDLCLKDSFFFIKNIDVCYSMNTSIHRDVYGSNYTITKYWYNFMKRRFEKLELYMMYKEEMKSMIGSISFLTNCIYHIGLHVWKIMWLERLLKFSEENMISILDEKESKLYRIYRNISYVYPSDHYVISPEHFWKGMIRALFNIVHWLS